MTTRETGPIQAANRSLPGRHLFAELIHAHLALLNLFSRVVGITPGRLELVHEFLHAGPDGVCLSDLALRLGVTPALVTRRVKELEKEGWVRRRADVRDGRRSIVCLTARGKNNILKLHERAHRFESTLTENLNPEDITAAVRVLSHLSLTLGSWRRTGRPHLNEDWPDGRG